MVAKTVDDKPRPSAAARRIRTLRRGLKLSRKQLADKLGVTYLQVYRIECGITAVDQDKASMFGRALGADPVEILFGRRAA